jgi:hypothetical protein
MHPAAPERMRDRFTGHSPSTSHDSNDSVVLGPIAHTPHASPTSTSQRHAASGFAGVLRRGHDRLARQLSRGSLSSEEGSPIAAALPRPAALTYDRRQGQVLAPPIPPCRPTPSPPEQTTTCLPVPLRHRPGPSPMDTRRRLSDLAYDIHVMVATMDRLRLQQYALGGKLARLKQRVQSFVPPLLSAADTHMWDLINRPMVVQTVDENIPTAAQTAVFLDKAARRREAIAQAEQRIVEDILLEHGDTLSASEWSIRTAERTLRLRCEDLMLQYRLALTQLTLEQAHIRNQLSAAQREERALRWPKV